MGPCSRPGTQHCTAMLWSIDSCHNRVSAYQYRMTVSRAQVSTNWGYVFLFCFVCLLLLLFFFEVPFVGKTTWRSFSHWRAKIVVTGSNQWIKINNIFWLNHLTDLINLELFKTFILNFAYIHSKTRQLGMFIFFQKYQFVYRNKVNSPPIRQFPSLIQF